MRSIDVHGLNTKEAIEQIIKFIDKAYKEAKRVLKLETVLIPSDICYDEIPNLASEAREKLNQVRPLTIGQANRISGVNPADISILLVYLESRRK